ncbi:MAG: type II secretion system protein M [Bdellovibrionales bacterium]|nr:type II secretion system protein M [Bdellovibrionales bacterium]
MASEPSAFSKWLGQVGEKLNEQVWFQQLKAKWDELDPQSKQAIQYGGMGLMGLGAFYLVISTAWQVRELRNDLTEKTELLGLLQSSVDEMKRLKDITAAAGQDAGSGSWSEHVDSVARSAGMDKTNVTVAPEKPVVAAAGTTSDGSKESLIEVSFKKIDIRKLTRFAFNLENGNRPAKIRALTVNTGGTPDGYIDASVTFSGFTLK